VTIKATPFIKLLQSVLHKSVDEKLEQVRSILPSVESGAVKSTEPLARQFVMVLTSVSKSPEITPSQLAFAAELRARVDLVDPRSQSEKTIKSPERPQPEAQSPKLSDGFDRSINAIEALSRVRLKYPRQPDWTDLQNENLIQAALDTTPIEEHSVQQLWLALACDFKERLGCVESSLSPQTKWLTAAICQIAIARNFQIPTPNCLTFIEELAFRS